MSSESQGESRPSSKVDLWSFENLVMIILLGNDGHEIKKLRLRDLFTSRKVVNVLSVPENCLELQC